MTNVPVRVNEGSGPGVAFKDNGDGTISQVITSSAHDDEYGKIVSGNVREKWRVGYSSMAEVAASFTSVVDPTDLVFCDGNVAGCNWLDICKSAFVPSTETVFLARRAFNVPYALEVGIGLSQRLGGQQFAIEMVGVNADSDGNVTGVISTGAALPAPNPISGNIVVASSVWTIPCVNQVFGVLRAGDIVVIEGCADPRLNVGPTPITAIGSSAGNILQITSSVPGDATHTGWTGGQVRMICPCGGADYHHGLRFWGTSSNNADAVSRNGAAEPNGQNQNRPRIHNWNPGNGQTDSAIPNEGGVNYSGQQYARAFRSKGLWRTEHVTGMLTWVSKDQDSTSGQRSTYPRESEVPQQDQWYAMRIRGINFGNHTVPCGTAKAITAISKAGTTTWTVTLPGHGRTINDRVVLYGMRDTAGFPALTTATVVSSVLDADRFTVVSTTGTATSYGGVCFPVQGGSVPATQSIAVQSYAKSYDGLRLVLTGSGTWTETVGNVVTVAGLVNSSNVAQTALHGRYRVARLSTTTLELEPLDGQDAAVAAISGSVTAGGAVIRNTSFRIHYSRILDYVRMLVEPANVSGLHNKSFPVAVTGGSVSASQGSRGTVGAGWYVAPDNVLTTDVTSAAITTTTTTGTITPTPVGGAAVFTIPVTAVSGTSPTMDVAVEESDDTGTNWYRIYEFPRITATGIYRSPQIPLSGNRIRYVQTIGGTSPSFTRAINRTSHLSTSPTKFRQRFDRAVSLTTLNAATVQVLTGGANSAQLVVNVGAITTTAPQLQLKGTDDNGATWFAIGAPLTAVANSTVRLTVTDVVADQIRAEVSTAGVGVTPGYVMLRSYGDAT